MSEVRENLLRRLLKLLIPVALLFLIFVFFAIPGLRNLPRAAYHYSRQSAITIEWNGVEMKLPPPWFRLDRKDEVAGTAEFFRDQFPWAKHAFSSITFKPPISNDFDQNPEQGMRQWEQLKNAMWSIPNPYPKVIDSYYSDLHSAKHDFRCANTVRMAQKETLTEMECIETRSGWRFVYEGVPEHASEARSILKSAF